VILAAGIALALLTALIWPWELRLGVDPKWMAACTFAELGGVALAFVAMRRGGAAAITIVLAAICMQRAVEDGSIYPSIPKRAFFPSVPLVSAIPRDPLYRVVGLGPYLRPNVATMFRPSVLGSEPIAFGMAKRSTSNGMPRARRSAVTASNRATLDGAVVICVTASSIEAGGAACDAARTANSTQVSMFTFTQ